MFGACLCFLFAGVDGCLFFLWKNNQELTKTIATKRESISDELADVFIFLTYLSNDLGIDLNEAVNRKIDKNDKKYPIEKSRGSNKKYDEL